MSANSRQPKQLEQAKISGQQPGTAGYTPRPWCCARGHTLGHVVKPGGVRRLAVEGIVFYDDGRPMNVELLITGPAELTCWCGAVRVWDMHEDGMTELLARRRAQRSAQSP